MNMRRVTMSILVVVASAGALKAEQPAAAEGAGKGVEVAMAQGGNLLFVRAKINDQDAGYFVVDTGATDTAVDKVVAKRLRLPVTGRAKATGAVGSSTVTTHGIRSLALGDARFGPGKVIATDLGLWRTALGVPVAGLGLQPADVAVVVGRREELDGAVLAPLLQGIHIELIDLLAQHHALAGAHGLAPFVWGQLARLDVRLR